MSTKHKNMNATRNPPPTGPAPTPPASPPERVPSAVANIVNELQVKLDERERQLEDALSRLDDALQQQADFVPHGDDPLLDLSEAGELVGRSHQTIRNMINQKMLRCTQEPGGLMRVRRSSLVKLYSEAFIIDEEQREREAQAAERRRRESEPRAMDHDPDPIEAPPEGGDTYINPILLQLRREREPGLEVSETLE